MFKFRNWMKWTSLALITALLVGLVGVAVPVNAQGGGGVRMQRGSGIVFRALMQATVKVTQLDRTEILRQWLDDKTLAQIITAKGAAVDAVKAEAISQATALIEQAVTRGRLTRTQADEMIAGLDAQITAMLNTTYEQARQTISTQMATLGVELALFKSTLDATGLTRQELYQQLSAEGATFASVITANGAAVADVKAAAKTLITERLTAAVSSGKITQAAADELLATLDQALDSAINSGLPEGFRQIGGKAGNVVDRVYQNVAVGALVAETASQSKLTQRQLLVQLSAGKTLAEIATAHAADPAAIVSAVVSKVTTAITTRVTNGQLSQEQADQILNGLAARLTETMNQQNPLQGRDGRRGRFGRN
ncbi:MAG: hypothetical protein KF726_27790 [Anaerolineae bacterium]|nr:hypothetical protein [Anaerolineae bacterium]